MRSPHTLVRRAALVAALAVLVVPAALASGSAAAAPARLSTDARCYLQGAPLRLTASGLAPNAPLTVALDGQALRYRDGSTPTSDVAGMFASSFATPALAPGVMQQRHGLAVGDGTHRPHARFTVTRPAGAEFEPSIGNPRTLRARFSVWGFDLAGAGPAPVWVHWVSPAGRVRASAQLGVARGDCGALTTAPRRVFPFDPQPGRWTLVVDAHRRYRVQTSGPRAKIPVHVRSLSS